MSEEVPSPLIPTPTDPQRGLHGNNVSRQTYTSNSESVLIQVNLILAIGYFGTKMFFNILLTDTFIWSFSTFCLAVFSVRFNLLFQIPHLSSGPDHSPTYQTNTLQMDFAGLSACSASSVFSLSSRTNTHTASQARPLDVILNSLSSFSFTKFRYFSFRNVSQFSAC